MQRSKPGFLVLVMAIALALPAMAEALTVTFDDIDASQADIPIPDSYQGLNWVNLTAYSAVPGFPGYNNGVVSGDNAAYGGGETAGPGAAPRIGSVTALSGQTFDFLGASFGAANYDDLSLTIAGLFRGAVIGTQTLTLSTAGAAFTAFSLIGLDTLTFTALRTTASTDPYACGFFDCTQFTIDNAVFVISDLPGPPVLTNVPEPATSALMLAGIGAVAWANHRRTRRKRPNRLTA